jgi:large subunit ribosomal protein L21
MFAVVEIGGRQYRVEPNQKFEVELLEQEPGAAFTVNKVLMVAESEDKANVGQPYVAGASVDFKVIDHVKGEKIRVFKFTAKKRFAKTQGHRQKYTWLEVVAIKG